MTWVKVPVRTLNASWEKLWIDYRKIKYVSNTQDAEDSVTEQEHIKNADIVGKIIYLAIEVNEDRQIS